MVENDAKSASEWLNIDGAYSLPLLPVQQSRIMLKSVVTGHQYVCLRPESAQNGWLYQYYIKHNIVLSLVT